MVSADAPSSNRLRTLATGPDGTLAAGAVVISDEQLLNYAELTYPDLFPSNPTAFTAVQYQGRVYSGRAYSNGSYLAVSDGEVWGLGAFSNHVVQNFGTVQSYASVVCAKLGCASQSIPGAPTSLSARAGDTNVTIAFSAPAVDGGAAITGYTASCIAGAASSTGTGAASPLLVAGLINGTTYNCHVMASNAAGIGPASSSVAVTPIAGSSTAAVACALSTNVYNNSSKILATSIANWTCSGNTRSLSGTGIPDHPVVGGRFADAVRSQNVNVNFPLTPIMGTATPTPNGQAAAYAFNSVKFDPPTAATCPSTATSTMGTGCVLAAGTDIWKVEALGGGFVFGLDENNGHVQPSGAYHYHGMPEGTLTLANKGVAMLHIGFVVDGYPLYARYGYSTATSATSAVRVMTSSYQKKTTPDAGRPPVSAFPMGTFTQDYQYVAGSGDLDECNGRFGVTPEFPGGIYHYYVTDTFPFAQRCRKGLVTR